jgi:hypothetical protein
VPEKPEKWRRWLRLAPEAKAYLGVLWRDASKQLSWSAYIFPVAVTAVALVIALLLTGEGDVVAEASIAVLLVALALVVLRAVVNAAAIRDREQEDQTRLHREVIAQKEQQLERLRLAHHIRQDVLGDLLLDLPDRQNAGDVREALINAAKRCGTFYALPDPLALVPERLEELEIAYQHHGESELAALIRAVAALQTTSKADPRP